MPPEIKGRPDISSLPSLDLVRNEARTEREETIPLSRITSDFSLVDEDHAEDLGNSMDQDRGQLTPILVRAREFNGEVVYDVIDGFHRTEGKRLRRAEDIRATVVYGCSDEEMYDLRILAASSVQSVQFPRVAEWIARSWDSTQWGQAGLPVHQAFAATINNSTETRGVKLNGQQLEEAKFWVRAKCAKWGKSVGAVYGILRVKAEADPELLKLVRSSGGGKDRQGRITPARLASVVEIFPGNAYFATQKEILYYAVGKRLSAEETRALALGLLNKIRPDAKAPRVRSLIRDYMKTLEEEYEAQVREKPSVSDGYESPSEAPPDNGSGGNPDGLINVNYPASESGHSSNTVRQEDFMPQNPLANTIDLNPHPGVLSTERLMLRISELEELLQIANQKLTENNSGYFKWWETANFLTYSERSVMTGLFTDALELKVLSKELDLPIDEILTFAQSAWAKWNLRIKETKSSKDPTPPQSPRDLSDEFPIRKLST